MKRILVVGYGYLGQRVAQRSLELGHRVWATTRSASKAAEMSAGSIQPLIVDWTDRRTLGGLPEVDSVLIAVSYDRSSRHSRYESQVIGLGHLLAALSPQAKLCYISTTGVYHQTGGPWVDEASPTHPTREGGSAHLQAENLLHRRRPQAPWTILRLAGIYGPGRVPRASDVIAGRPIASPGEGFLNLIHVEDAASAVLAAWARQCRRLYVVSDDQPVLRADFYRQIARLTKAPPPTFVEPPPEASERLRSTSNKRLWNRRMKSDLVPKLRFPSYREGLASIL